MKIQTIWKNFAYSGGIEDNSLNSRQIFFVNAFSLLGFLSVLIFGILHIVEKNTVVGILELVGAEVFLLNLFLLRVNNNISVAKTILLIIQGALLVVQLGTGGIAHTGIYWFFTFPLSSFFLMGKEKGIISNLLLFIVVLVIANLSKLHTVSIVYTFIEIRQLLATLVVICTLMYVYQQAIEKSLQLEKNLEVEKSEFIVLASHQLRTPISAIAWFSEMLLHGDAGRLTKEQEDHLIQIYQSNKRMAYLVDAMLQASQLESNSFPIKPETIKFTELSHKILVDEVKRQNTVRIAHVEELYDPAITTIFFDPNIAKIILQNLFSNALKYTPSSGSIKIEIRLSRQKPYTNDITSNEGILIKVQDTGYGIPASQRRKIFTKMFRAENTKVKDTDGTGLGLYIIKLLLQQIGGNIRFESKENKGTTFIVWLPKIK
ncbi:MAG TPA: HAMP domain-containing sensor histidine kinase [Candidatus Saccharimonadales bacterium]|nr:HAMP domain-containing sensor histidine kinase [Candidatus Saccharimonadales bacterium]